MKKSAHSDLKQTNADIQIDIETIRYKQNNRQTDKRKKHSRPKKS